MSKFLKSFAIFAAISVSAVCVSSAAFASTAYERAQSYAKSRTSLSLNFTQEVLSMFGRPEVSSGTVDMSIKNKQTTILWKYTQPTPQTILVHKDQVFVYVPELKQMSITPVDVTTTVLLRVLFGQDISQEFVWNTKDAYFELYPAQEHPNISRIKAVIAEDGQVTDLYLFDHLQTETHLILTSATRSLTSNFGQKTLESFPKDTEIVRF